MDYFHPDRNTAEDDEGIMLALEQHDRVRRVRLWTSAWKLQKFIMAINEEYPLLEYLIIQPSDMYKITTLMLPETLQAPRLHHLMLSRFALPIGSRLLTNAASIVTLCLFMDHPSSYLQPNTLLLWISFMPQLETLIIKLFFSLPKHHLERQLIDTPIIPHVTIPNLHFLVLQGTSSAYVEAVIRRITTPRLEKLDIWFFKQLTFSVPCLQHFINTTANLRFDSAKLMFSWDAVLVGVYLREEIEIAQIKMIPLLMVVHSRHLDWQVSSVAQILYPPNQTFTTVEHLTLEHIVHDQSSEEHNEVDRSEWRKLLRAFGNVKTLRIGDGLVKEVSHSLQLDDGELPLELLPELQSLTYSGIGDTGDAFTPFINARQNAGHPITLVRPYSRPTTPEIFNW